MMNNLFSIFDSNTNNFIELNWSSSWINIILLPSIFWFLNSRITKFLKNTLNLINKEFNIILKNKFNTPNTLIFVTLLMFIFFNNFMGLFPYIFTSSSHMIFSITFSLPLWMTLMIFGWLHNPNHMFSHMIPEGTPNFLMPLMVLIETTSNLIRPSTLTIRLTANMIAGHLLLTLMSETASTPLIMIKMIIIILQIILLILEFSVSIIQSYVFSILSTLYSKESN